MNLEEAKTQIEKFYNELNFNNLDTLESLYDDSIIFQDPMCTIHGIRDLKKYFGKMYKSVKSISFEFHDFIIQDEKIVAFWTMTYSAQGLNWGKEIRVDGNSLLKFSNANKLVYHRDYFDVGAMLYEHLPAVGFVVKKIKNYLESHD
jgi:limonene-1,2-epoxide hydrolase